MHSFLEQIIENKKEEIQHLYTTIGLTKFEREFPPINPYSPHAFHKAISKKGLSLIAEIKKASPSKGIIRPDFDPIALAQLFESKGASALSVLTETKFFLGHSSFIPQVKAITKLPILRKDFIIDPIQVYESKKLGADAILLIKAILSEHELRELQTLAHKIGLDVLVEIHSLKELDEISPLGCPIIGINNRDLSEFTVDTSLALKIAQKIPLSTPPTLIVAESGYTTTKDILPLKHQNFAGVLIGEGLATHPELLQLENFT